MPRKPDSLPEGLVPLKEVLDKKDILEIPILSTVADPYTAVPGEPSLRVKVLQQIFFRTFAEESRDDFTKMLPEVAGFLSKVPTDLLTSSITHPELGEDPWLSDVHPALEQAFKAVFEWLVSVMKWGWIVKKGVAIPDGYDHGMPWWFFYSCLEMARLYLRYEPETYDSLPRARAFLRFDADRLDRVVPRDHEAVILQHHGLEEVTIPQMTMCRWRGETRDQFALRVASRVLNWTLHTIAEQANEDLDLIKALGIDSLAQENLRGDLLVRSRELVRRMLGKEVESEGGSSLKVHIRYANLLGFLRPTPGS
jgi:hypothetical protein